MALTQQQLQSRILLVDGSSTNLAALITKGPVYIKFWASWCKSCMQQMPHFQAIHQQFGENITVLGVNVWLNESLPDVNKVISKFNLTLPVGLDKKGELAKAFNFIGTPFHLLIDEKGRVVHSGYEADKDIDQKISLLATGKLTNKKIDIALPSAQKQKAVLASFQQNTSQPRAFYFTSTWCDWYLADTRSAMATQCADTQKWLAQLKLQNVEIVLSRLWTGEQDISDYQKKYGINKVVTLDETNILFDEYKIRQFPTLLVVKNGKELARETEFTSLPALAEQLLSLGVK